MEDNNLEKMSKTAKEPEIETFTTGAQTPVSKRTLTIQQCSQHTAIDLSIFCRDCNTLICPVCLTQNHQKHEMCDISTIHNEKLQILENHLSSINREFVPFFSEEKSKLDEVMQLHQNYFVEMRDKTEVQDRKLKEAVTKQTTHLIEKLETFQGKVKADIANRKLKLEETLLILEKNYELIEKTKDSDNIKTICKNADEMLVFINEVDITSIALPRKALHYENGTIGSNTITSLVGVLHSYTLKDTAKPDFKVFKSYNTDLKAIEKVTIGEKVWVKNSHESILREIELTDGLKNIQEKRNIKIRDMAVNKSGDLLLAFENKPFIKIMRKNSDEIETLHAFEVPWFCKPQVPLSLKTIYNDKILVGTLEKGGNSENLENMHRKVMIFTGKGEKLREYEFDLEGKRLFTFPYRVTANHTNGDMIILDKSSNNTAEVISIKKEGVQNWVYNANSTDQSQPFDPVELVITKHGNIIICDMRNHALHIVNSDGYIIKYQQLEPLELKFPRSMDIDNKGRLIMGCGSNSENEAKIFSLEFSGC